MEDIIDIREKYDNGYYRYYIYIPKKVTDDYVFDENLSVKRNREMVAEYNQKIDDMHNEKRDNQAKLDKLLTNDVVSYIVNTYHMNREQASFVERFCYVEKHSYMGDYFSHIDEVAEMVENVLKANNN